MSEEKNKDNTVNEPISGYSTHEQITPQIIWELFKETDKQFKETDRKMQETDRKMQETDRQFKETDRKMQETIQLFADLEKEMVRSNKEWQEIKKELGGIGNSAGEIAEDYFYSALSKNLRVGAMTFDQIERNRHRKKNNLEAEYDIVLSDDHKVLIVEVKHKFKIYHLQDFYKEKIKRFKSLFPEYKNYKVYGAIAAMTYAKGVIDEAKKYGFLILTQDNDTVKILNDKDFLPNEIR